MAYKNSRPWTLFYENEESLIDDMLKTKSDPEKYPLYQVVKGYAYIGSFKDFYAKHGFLTDAQTRQLKRMAGEVYLNVHRESPYYDKVWE